MKATATLSLLLYAVLLAPPGSSADVPIEPPSDGVLWYTGEAVDADTGAFLYGERHAIRYGGGRIAERIVLYTCRSGQPFARKIVDYGQRPVAPDFALEDAITGFREGIRPRAAKREVYFRRDARSRERAEALAESPSIVADAGFDEFVRREWDRLAGGDALRVDFVIPDRLDTFSFRVRRLRGGSVGAVPVEVFRLTVSGVLGWFAPHIDVHYSRDTRVLMRYEGISNVRDRDGDNYRALIDFAAADRRVADDAGLIERTRAEPLATACD